jgi:hypothetical protein
MVENATLLALAEKYNQTYGSKLRVRGKSILLVPTEMIRDFFHPVISNIMHHLGKLLEVSASPNSSPG